MSTERQCVQCGRTFRGGTKKCSVCQGVNRQCITCGKTFRSRYLECGICRTAPGTCEFPGCDEPKVRGRGAKQCQKHRDEAYERKLERLRKTTCYMPGCPEPKRPGKYRYCAKHSAEGPQRERAQIGRRRREREFGVTHEQFLVMLDAQGSVCAICGNGNGNDRQLSIDHDHETGAVRGLLCDRCNPMLGYARDRIEILLAAIEYLTYYANQVFKPAGV